MPSIFLNVNYSGGCLLVSYCGFPQKLIAWNTWFDFLATCISFVKHLFTIFCLFWKLSCLYFLLLGWRSSLHPLDTKPTFCRCFLTISDFWCTFWWQKLLVSISNINFWWLFYVLPKKSLLTSKVPKIFSCFLLEALQFGLFHLGLCSI